MTFISDISARVWQYVPLIALYLQDFMLELLATLLNGGLQVLSIAQAADSVRVSRSTH